MENLIKLSLLTIFLIILFSFSNAKIHEKLSVYSVNKATQAFNLNGKWDDPQWRKCKVLEINSLVGKDPKFRPLAEAKVMYNEEGILVIFRVKDRFVRCVTHEVNGPVWDDSCVEFFFSPDQNSPDKYFNLEVNCGGTALMHYNTVPRKEFKVIQSEDVQRIEIAHSLPKITDPENPDPVTWTIAYVIPFSLLEKYAHVTRPKKGVSWRANFYKIADKTSNQHYISWSPIENGVVDYHQPQFFGVLKFE
ncbi:MAG: carbohydrate-binding family 9-like protein [Prolixibacteraceae bacterium]|jgi:hypothetical protein|nr:carbohydrate-binding family 9-like protein [Prolixibacteraceae bacterium]